MGLSKKVSSFVLIILSLVKMLSAQEVTSVAAHVFKGRVLDAEEGLPIIYASIFNKTSGHGTISNQEGFFSLEACREDDSLEISFVGYKTKKLVFEYDLNNHNIYLKQKDELLDEVVISADDAFLYELVTASKKTQSWSTKASKTYFLLDSKVNGQMVELVECYYNGHFAGYDIDELNLKNGRVALSVFDNHFFVSTETSKAIGFHKLFDKSALFPGNPFQISKSKLRKNYSLTRSSKYKNDHNSTTYVINYSPKKDTANYFSGRIWIDSADAQIQKVELKVKSAHTHPFKPLGNADSLLNVDLQLNKTFNNIGGRMYVKSVDFTYDLRYRTSDEKLIDVSSHAVLYAYHYNEVFILPFFKFTKGMYEDYRKINATPYNDFFWENTKEFKLKERHEINRDFIKKQSTISNKNLFVRNNYLSKGFFEHPYIFWSNKRILMREELEKDIDGSEHRTLTPSQKYNLQVQIFLDINNLNDSVHILTATVFDPFKSYYYFPMTDAGITFINMYFDLVEIYRRKLVLQINEKGRDVDTIKHLYEEIALETDSMSKTFFGEVERGIKKTAMKKWNLYIYEKLGIDNLDIFKPYEEIGGE